MDRHSIIQVCDSLRGASLNDVIQLDEMSDFRLFTFVTGNKYTDFHFVFLPCRSLLFF